MISVREKTVGIYVAGSIFDKMPDKKYHYMKEEKLLQVGAALTNKRISSDVLVDCTGDNISEKNKQYCELTGLYWIWKNASEDYVGLVQYRRHFVLPPDWLQRMVSNEVDAILPVPLYVAPSVAENYRERHCAGDWDYMMEYLREKSMEDYMAAQKVFGQNLYSPCNMLVAKRETLSELCRWLFPIVDAVAEHGGKKEDVYQNRYPGFLSERLITCFFEKCRAKYKVVYANKNFLAI